MQDRFETLIRDFCAETNFSDPSEIMCGTPFLWDQIPVSLFYRPEINGNLLFTQIEFGEVSRNGEIETYYELLRENFLDFPVENASFGISPITGRIVYSAAHVIDNITPDHLVTILVKLTAQAQEWQAEHPAKPYRVGTDHKSITRKLQKSFNCNFNGKNR